MTTPPPSPQSPLHKTECSIRLSLQCTYVQIDIFAHCTLLMNIHPFIIIMWFLRCCHVELLVGYGYNCQIQLSDKTYWLYIYIYIYIYTQCENTDLSVKKNDLFYSVESSFFLHSETYIDGKFVHWFSLYLLLCVGNSF